MNLKTFCITRDIYYEERCVDDPVFHKFYEIRNPKKEQVIVIPDGCIDFQCVWKNGIPMLNVCGSFQVGAKTVTGTFEKCIGFKLNPGIVLECFQDSVSEIVNRRLDYENFSDQAGELLRIMALPIELKEKVPLIREIFGRKNETRQQDMVLYLIEEIQKKDGTEEVCKLVDTLGYSQRYVEKVFKEAVGFTIKKYAGIMRMQKALELLTNENKTDCEIYDRLGYYDQAHYIHEFKRFTSLTPNAYRKNKELVIV